MLQAWRLARSREKGVPKFVPLNRLAMEALQGSVPRIGGRYFSQWKDPISFKYRWQETCTRAGVHDLHFHDLRHYAERRTIPSRLALSLPNNVSVLAHSA